MSKKYHIITFGCQMNKNDSEHIAGMLEFNGLKQTLSVEEANVVILNTCSVRDKAERRVYGQLDNLNHLRKTKELDMQLFLAGCMPAYDKDNIQKKVGFLDGFIDLEEARQYPAKRELNHQAWISIMYGCNNYCSYCIVPFTRGQERSKPLKEIIDEISAIDKTTHTEIMLLGQNVNSYQHQETDFAGLLEKICLSFPSFKKISFLTSHPKDISSELIEVIAQTPQIDREIHFPLQAASNKILALMNRKYTYLEYKEKVALLRQKVPDIKISTDLIVGFPGEEEQEFQETLAAVKELAFYRINTAAFSPRKGTKAARLKDPLSAPEKNRRLNILNELSKEMAVYNL